MSSRKIINMLIDDSDSEDDLEMILASMEGVLLNKRRRVMGSIPGHKTIFRNRIFGHKKIFNDYFGKHVVYSSKLFRRRFRMRQSLFIRIQADVEIFDLYFVQKRNSAGTLGLSSLQKITAAMRMLAYGVSADYVDEYVRIGGSTAIEILKRFVKAVISIYSEKYLRSPNKEDVAILLKEGKNRGFPGMLGSIDCMHWKWKNCPVAWKGMYVGHVNEPTIILEAIASHDLWIWHAFFGLPGSHNDINVLDRSFLFTDLVEGRAPPANYSVNGHDYTMGYYLVDGIYPPWSTFVKTIPSPRDNKHKTFAAAQESARKDVERAFGVLQSRFAIIRGPARFWHRETLKDIMKACIILHNMIVEDERDARDLDFNYDALDDAIPPVSVSHEHTTELMKFIQCHHRIRDRNIHSQLQTDLIEHIWQIHGAQ
ncbi:hypothetical protein DH2020_016007 [Rehmannia glutinosa]|uniref:Nuclease n=1 Tax=Rehmannia glutinosa TaxID=99300 RepID=A0ABR0WXY9_REHGL